MALKIKSELLQFHPLFSSFLLISAIIAGLRFFTLSQPLLWGARVLLFLAGLILAHVFFTQEGFLIQQIEKLLPADQEPPHTHPDGAAPLAPTPLPSPLRHGLILVVLPILTILMIVIANSAFGLGFLWGVAVVYAYDMWDFVSHKRPELGAVYFPSVNQPEQLRLISLAYLGYVFFFAILLVLPALSLLSL